MCLWYFELSLIRKVMEGKGGGLGSRIMHCKMWLHSILECTWDKWRGISFHGWEMLEAKDFTLVWGIP